MRFLKSHKINWKKIIKIFLQNLSTDSKMSKIVFSSIENYRKSIRIDFLVCKLWACCTFLSILLLHRCIEMWFFDGLNAKLILEVFLNQCQYLLIIFCKFYKLSMNLWFYGKIMIIGGGHLVCMDLTQSAKVLLMSLTYWGHLMRMILIWRSSLLQLASILRRPSVADVWTELFPTLDWILYNFFKNHEPYKDQFLGTQRKIVKIVHYFLLKELNNWKFWFKILYKRSFLFLKFRITESNWILLLLYKKELKNSNLNMYGN